MSSRRSEGPSELDLFAKFCVDALTLEDGSALVLHPFQRTMLEDLFGGTRETLILIPKKNGKALALDTPIPTPDGWTKQGDLVPGDEVFGEDGRRCRVVAVTAPMVGRPCYRVSFSDQTDIVADAEHEWWTRLISGAQAIRTTRQIAETLLRPGDGARNHSIAVAGALECEAALLPVDPYVLGAWVGDGTTMGGSVTFGEPFVRNEITRCGYTVASGHPRLTATVYGLQKALRALGVLGAKHIPGEYLRAGTSDRLALLQGIMDTDGYISEAGQAELVTVKPRLRDDYLELIRSLGFKPSLKTDRATLYGRDCGARYRIQFWAFVGAPVFRMPRKLHRQKLAPSRRPRSVSRQIVAVDQVPSVPVRCIEVDSPSRLYLAGRGMVPTHNSTLLGALALFHLCTTPDAECVIAAASRDQAQIMLRQAQGFIRRSPGLQLRLQVKQREIVHRSLGGRVRVLASDVDTADGVIPTLALVDELHRHKSADLYGVFRDGLGPRQGRMVTISTAGADEDSPLGHLRAKAHAMPGLTRDGAYRTVRSDGFAMHEWALDAGDDRDDLELVKCANPAPWQTLEELEERHASPSMTPWQWARFACGVWGIGNERAFDPDLWESLAKPGALIEPGRKVTLGFDGARRFDTTALVAVDILSGHIEVVGSWARPMGAGDDWEISETEVDQAVAYAFDRWDVWRLYGDPPYWESALDRWAGEYGEDRVVRWWTNRMKAMAYALRAFVGDMRPDAMSHSGDEVLAGHIANAAKHETRMREGDDVLWVIRKDSPKSPRKIDVAMATVLAWEARGDAITAGVGNEPVFRRAQW